MCTPDVDGIRWEKADKKRGIRQYFWAWNNEDLLYLQDNDGARYSVAAAALVVLIGAVVFSGRKSNSIAGAAA